MKKLLFAFCMLSAMAMLTSCGDAEPENSTPVTSTPSVQQTPEPATAAPEEVPEVTEAPATEAPAPEPVEDWTVPTVVPKELWTSDGTTISSVEVRKSDDLSPVLVFHILNQSNNPLIFNLDNITINGRDGGAVMSGVTPAGADYDTAFELPYFRMTEETLDSLSVTLQITKMSEDGTEFLDTIKVENVQFEFAQ